MLPSCGLRASAAPWERPACSRRALVPRRVSSLPPSSRLVLRLCPGSGPRLLERTPVPLCSRGTLLSRRPPGPTGLASRAGIPAHQRCRVRPGRVPNLASGEDAQLQAWDSVGSPCVRGGALKISGAGGCQLPALLMPRAAPRSQPAPWSEHCSPRGRRHGRCSGANVTMPGKAEQSTRHCWAAAASLGTKDGSSHFSCGTYPDFKTRPNSP